MLTAPNRGKKSINTISLAIILNGKDMCCKAVVLQNSMGLIPAQGTLFRSVKPKAEKPWL